MPSFIKAHHTTSCWKAFSKSTKAKWKFFLLLQYFSCYCLKKKRRKMFLVAYSGLKLNCMALLSTCCLTNFSTILIIVFMSPAGETPTIIWFTKSVIMTTPAFSAAVAISDTLNTWQSCSLSILYLTNWLSDHLVVCQVEYIANCICLRQNIPFLCIPGVRNLPW